MKIARALVVSAYLTAMALSSGCAVFRETPPTESQFMDTGYIEMRADPGRVLAERVKMHGPTRAGERHGYPVLCGFVDFARRIVWTARDIACPVERTRRHERCHIDAHEAGVKDECHDGRKF